MTMHIDGKSTLQDTHDAAVLLLSDNAPPHILYELVEQFRRMVREIVVPIEFRADASDGPVIVRVYGPAGRKAGMEALRKAKAAGQMSVAELSRPESKVKYDN